MHFRFAFEFLRFYFGDKTAKATATAAYIYEKDDAVASRDKTEENS